MEIFTKRLHLREVIPQDLDVIATYRTHPEYLEHYYRDAYTREECKAFVELCIHWAQEDPRTKFQLSITSRASGELLGNCGIRCDRANSPIGEIGYELAPEYWGRGFATEAARAMLHFGFETLQLTAVKARCVVANERSIRLLHKLAFQEAERLPPGPGKGVYQNQHFPERCVFLLSRNNWLKSDFNDKTM